MIISKKAIIFGGLLLFCLIGGTIESLAQSRTSRQTREEYVERYKAIAIDHMERYGIPASITMAQGILESDSGNSFLSRSSNNHFGIKCKRNWTGDRVYHDDDEAGECFRAYPTVEDSYEDHARFLDEQPRYDSLFVYSSDDYRSWARGLKACGYATAPDYAERLVRIIEDSKLYLLDKPDGGRLYADRLRAEEEPDEWFTSQSSTNEHTPSMGIDPDNFRVTINAHEGYEVYRTNNTHYVLAKERDTYENIAAKFRLSAKNLRKFNDLTDQKAQPMTGEVVYIERKRNKWEEDSRIHFCRTGETVYAIGQKYGIRSRSIEKMNKLKRGTTTLEQGTPIRLQ